MKVLFITHKYPPSVGGMEKQCFELVKGVSKITETILIKYDASKQSKFLFFLGLRKLVRATLKQHPDISLIHLNDGLMTAFTLWLRKETNIPVVATFHGLDLLFPLGIYQKWIIPKFSYLSKFIAVSSHTEHELIKRGMPKEKIVTIHNGVNHNAGQSFSKDISINHFKNNFQIDLANKKVILMVGRPVKRKGMSWFVDHVLRNLEEDYHVIIAGSFGKPISTLQKFKSRLPQNWQDRINLFFGYPDDKQSIEILNRDAGISQKLTLLPRLSDIDLDHLYRISNLFVMPNIKVTGDMEGFGLVALEASIRGLPVLCSGIEGIKDAIREKKNGFNAESGNAEDWINKINWIFQKEEQLDMMARAFKTYTIDTFSWSKMSADYVEVFKSIGKGKELSGSYSPNRDHDVDSVYKLVES